MAKNRKKRQQLTEDIVEHLDYIQRTIDDLSTSSGSVQQKITSMIREQLQRFEIKDRRFIAGQDLRSRILLIEEKIEKILSGKIYTNAVSDYLSSFTTIEKATAGLHKTYNELQVDLKLLTPARRLVYEQAKDALYGSGIDASFKTPVNHMLMLQVTTGGTIADAERMLELWQQGMLTAQHHSPTGKTIPNLSQYATQLARDTSYQLNGTFNEIIAQEYALDGIHYAGDIIKDSRPLCVHLVNLRRDVSKSELEELLSRHDLKPGRIPGTNVQNFCTYRGGYSCRHMAFPVRIRKTR